MPATRTPEGEPGRCHVCRQMIRMEASWPMRDAPCPHCGTLLVFAKTRIVEHVPPSLARRVVRRIRRKLAAETYWLRCRLHGLTAKLTAWTGTGAA